MAKYNMTLEDYKKMESEQNGVCAICGLGETRIVKAKARKYISKEKPRLSIDHDHNTGAIRGLLCAKCNIALGHFQDSIENLEKAIEYLRKYI